MSTNDADFEVYPITVRAASKVLADDLEVYPITLRTASKVIVG